MKEILTKSGYLIQVDDEDYDKLLIHKWHISRTNKNNLYAMRHAVVNGKQTKLYLHREVLGFPENIVDHKDLNGLNCQKANLQLSNKSKNGQNRRAYGKIKYLGVSEHENKFRMQIWATGKRYSKLCKTKEEAALMYNEYAKIIYGETARLNTLT